MEIKLEEINLEEEEQFDQPLREPLERKSKSKCSNLAIPLMGELI